MNRIGVFVCHCGINIASIVDIEAVTKEISKYPGVEFIKDYQYMCSEPGQMIFKEACRSGQIDGIVVASCSPTLHETTFRRASIEAGMNPYRVEIANIREQCSWVHHDEEEKATEKAIDIMKSVIERSRRNESLTEVSLQTIKKVLVIGAGISGMQVALNIANSGVETFLLDRQPSIGGRMAQLSETFPTLDCSQCILTPRMVEVGQNKNITLMTYSEVEEVSGYVGNFNVKIRRKAAYVDWDKCTGCGICYQKCPKTVPSEFEQLIGKRKAIYTPFPQAVPNKVVIDNNNCLYFKTGKCRLCEKACPLGAIDFEQKERIEEIEVGAIVVATGYDLYEKEKIEEYKMGYCEDVLDGLTFERLLSSSGPTQGKLVRPSDGTVPKEIVFIQCVGSRDPDNHLPYCSRICCMYTAKHTMLYKHRVPDGQPYVFYMDIRSGGKNYEEFVQRAIEEDNVLYIRGRVARLYREDDKVVVVGADTLSGKTIVIRADMVVLAMAMRPSGGIEELSKKLKIQVDGNGFLSEAHPKLRPVETLTQGVFVAGCAQAPKDITDTVSQAGAAASKVLELLSNEKLLHDPITSWIDEELCAGCGQCVSQCSYNAIQLDEKKRKAFINEILCQGCGACIVTCPSGAAQQKNFTIKQYYSMIESLV
ncbi:MAG: CoB--CoM heterodisulfide reductase iron-sulfur subunit A family protein [Spirochaetota bacterium]|nr:MAG: CoB--CoM heterodisulfide reductase iron-sulfur subunit A family protein [Spirochaetota bacterium]